MAHNWKCRRRRRGKSLTFPVRTVDGRTQYVSRHTTGEAPLGLSSKNVKYLQVAGFRQVASSDKLR